MANASGFFAPSIPRLRGRLQPTLGINRSGFYSFDGIPKKVFCFSAIDGVEKHTSSVSPSEPWIPRLLDFQLVFLNCKLTLYCLSAYQNGLDAIGGTSLVRCTIKGCSFWRDVVY